ncbi:cytochrome P450 monooxygenase [Coccidioides immitis RS]|uniref:Cytochrome P450 monooxygenase n=1 Tax=Coccidioides immitis (strain RS) TaxID=246410 RepID=J3K7L8_COCIM|nr:cytochrome P450 monooxygenase [Coccidioides immitis RS]EAS30709.3 cytochrome P450 monooxygenase [Coccidioides immitis RS]
MLLLAGTLFTLAFVIYKKILYPLFFSPLAKIPSAHPLASVSSLWIQWKRLTNKEFDAVVSGFRQKGPYIRLAPKEVAVNTMECGVKNIYGIGNDNFDKAPWYNFFQNHGRRISGVYSKSFLQSSPHIRAILDAVIQQRILPILARTAEKEEPIDILALNLAYGLDFVSAFIFGLPRGVRFLENTASREDWLDLYDQTHPSKNMFWLTEHPVLSQVASLFGIPLIPRNFLKAKRELENWAMKRIKLSEDVLSNNPTDETISPGHMPLLYHALKTGIELEQGEKRNGRFEPNNIQRHELASECLDHLGITFSYVILNLSRNLEIQEQLRQELLSISQPFRYHNEKRTELPTPQTLEALPFLNAVIKESLRLRNTAPTLNPRITPTGRKVTIGPCDNVPAGTRVGAFAWCLHRNEEGYPNPRTWDPMRWIVDSSDPKAGARERWWWAFGSGSRQCLGQNLAFELMRFAVTAIYTNFRTSIIDDSAFAGDETFVTGDGSEQLILKIERVET